MSFTGHTSLCLLQYCSKGIIYEHATIKQFHVDKTLIMNSAEEDCWFKVSLSKGEPDKSLDFCWAILSVVAYNDLLSDQIKRRLIHTFLFLL